MTITTQDTHDILSYMAALEGRTPPTDAAVDAWYDQLQRLDVEDVWQAVRELYQHAGEKDRPTIGAVLSRARHLRDRRTRSRLAIAAPSTACPPTVEYLRARARLVQRLGNLERRPAAPRPDSTRPTVPDSEITDEVRRSAMDRLAAWQRLQVA